MSGSPEGALRILLLGDVGSTFVVGLTRHLKAEQAAVVGLVSHQAPRDGRRPEEVWEDVHCVPPVGAWGKRVPGLPTLSRLARIVAALWRRRRRYDILHIHFFGLLNALVASLAGRCFRRCVVTVYGSDLYRADRATRAAQRRAIAKIDLVTVANPETGRDLVRRFGERLPPVVTCRFGLAPLDELAAVAATVPVAEARARFGVPEGAVSVTCAHNRSPGNHHRAILEQIGELPEAVRGSLFLLLPMTYGEILPGYVDEIRELAARIGVRHRLLTSYLSNREVAELRLASDLFLHVPVSDQLSGTMQEHMYAGAVVVTGSWLPYGVFRDLGAEFLEIERIEDLASVLPSVLDDLENLKARARINRDLIWNLSNWETQIHAWIDMYRKVSLR